MDYHPTSLPAAKEANQGELCGWPCFEGTRRQHFLSCAGMLCSSTTLNPSFHTVPRSKAATKFEPQVELSINHPSILSSRKARLQPHHITSIINDGRQWANKHRNTSRLKEVEVSLVSFHLPQSGNFPLFVRALFHTNERANAPRSTCTLFIMVYVWILLGCEPHEATIRMSCTYDKQTPDEAPAQSPNSSLSLVLAPPLWSL